jgi:hypothetical protein
MAYGVNSINEQILIGSSQTENPTQLDTIIFTDFHSVSVPSTTVTAQGGVLYANSANGGALTSNTTAHFTAFGVTAASGVVSLSTGTSSNNTGYASIYTSNNILPGLPTPGTGLVTIYEYEVLLRTDTTIHDNTVRGFYRMGFGNSITNADQSDGVYFEFLYNGTTNDTTWHVAFRKDAGTIDRVDTTVTVAASKTYRMYLSVQANSDGTYTTTYKIKNLTDNTNTEGTATPTTTARIPTAAGDYMGGFITNSKTVTTTATARLIFLDYIGIRIRRPVAREILIFS